MSRSKFSLTDALRRPVAWVFLLAAAPSWAGAGSDENADVPRLIEFSTQAAVFESGDRHVLVRPSEPVPGSSARLVHVGVDSVLIEVPAVGGRGPLQMQLRRGEELVVPPPPAQDVTPAVAVSIIRADAPAPQSGATDSKTEGD